MKKGKQDRSIIDLEMKGERPGHYGSPGCSLRSKRGKRPPTGGLLSLGQERKKEKRGKKNQKNNEIKMK